MEVVQAEHAEMALVVMMHHKIEVRQKQAELGGQRISSMSASSSWTTSTCIPRDSFSSGGILKGTEAMCHFRELAKKHDEKQPVIVLSSGSCSPADQKRYKDIMGADVITWRKA
jgi:hypothetical protein